MTPYPPRTIGTTMIADAELLAYAILGGSSYPAHREAAERILARLTEPDAGEGLRTVRNEFAAMRHGPDPYAGDLDSAYYAGHDAALDELLALLDARLAEPDSERPSALDVEVLRIVRGKDPSRFHCPACKAELVDDLARLTEPDAGEGTEPKPLTGEAFRQFVSGGRALPKRHAPTPDTTEATLRTALTDVQVAHRHLLGDSDVDATDASAALVEVEKALRAALQQSAVEGGPE